MPGPLFVHHDIFALIIHNNALGLAVGPFVIGDVMYAVGKRGKKNEKIKWKSRNYYRWSSGTWIRNG